MSGDKKDFFYINRAKRRLFKKMEASDLFDLESELGSQIFGPTPNGVRREFFNLDKNSWIWHEEYTDGQGKLRKFTTRYEIQPNKVMKIQPGPRYFEIKGKELENFHKAVSLYHKIVLNEIYRKH